LKRKKYKSTHKLKVTVEFLLNFFFERMKSNICANAMLAQRVKEKTKDNNN